MRRLLFSRWMLMLSMLICRCALADAPHPLEQETARPLKLEVVDQVVEANDHAVQACNRNAHRLDTLAVMMSLTIDGDGRVTEAAGVPVAENAKLPPEAACLARVARRFKFPATGTVSHVAYPFMIVSRVRRALTF